MLTEEDLLDFCAQRLTAVTPGGRSIHWATKTHGRNQKVIYLPSSYVAGILHTARISTVEVIVR